MLVDVGPDGIGDEVADALAGGEMLSDGRGADAREDPRSRNDDVLPVLLQDRLGFDEIFQTRGLPLDDHHTILSQDHLQVLIAPQTLPVLLDDHKGPEHVAPAYHRDPHEARLGSRVAHGDLEAAELLRKMVHHLRGRRVALLAEGLPTGHREPIRSLGRRLDHAQTMLRRCQTLLPIRQVHGRKVASNDRARLAECRGSLQCVACLFEDAHVQQRRRREGPRRHDDHGPVPGGHALCQLRERQSRALHGR
mmetsp:Transcript_14159/g.36584  ORF Transcript_14159/g.36584 Transcript_14159/m.36584 type:complete len:251 (+) Transcript_14159:257-1009(+)